MGTSDPSFGIDNNDRTVIRPTPGRPKSGTKVKQVVPPGVSRKMSSLNVLKGENPFLDHAYTLLSMVPRLRNLPYFNAINELRRQLTSELRNFETQVLNENVPKNQTEVAKFFLCTLIDEAVLNTPWGSKSGWGHKSLSSEFYRNLAGGEEFFQILNQLKQQPSQNQNLLELAFLCLHLGFEGKYRYMNNGQHALEKLRYDIYQQIQQLKGDDLPALSSHCQGAASMPHALTRYVPLWVIASVTCVILMFIYTLFSVSIRDRSDDVFNQLSAIALNIEEEPALQPLYHKHIDNYQKSLKDQFRTILHDEIRQQDVDVTEEGKLFLFNMFHPGSAYIQYKYQATLAKVASILKKEKVQVQITGHTDSSKPKISSRFKSNWQLSKVRAENTAKALMDYGLPEDRLRIYQMADNEPIAPNNSEANRALNRRIEIMVR